MLRCFYVFYYTLHTFYYKNVDPVLLALKFTTGVSSLCITHLVLLFCSFLTTMLLFISQFLIIRKTVMLPKSLTSLIRRVRAAYIFNTYCIYILFLLTFISHIWSLLQLTDWVLIEGLGCNFSYCINIWFTDACPVVNF